MLAFLASALSIAGIILTAGFSLFPFLMPSSSNPRAGLTVWDASSSHMTLWIMVIAVAIFLPIVTLYTAWVYRVMRGKVTPESVGGTPTHTESGASAMWYFSWVLGLGLACAFAILNAMWFELREGHSHDPRAKRDEA